MHTTSCPEIHNHFCFLDNSNLLHEGQRLAGLRRGWARDIWEAQAINVLDPSWRMSYRALSTVLQTVLGRLARANAFVSFGSMCPPEAPARIEQALEDAGWRARMFLRQEGRGEKGVDVALASTMAYVAATEVDRRKSAICLIAGDADYVPLVDLLKEREYRVSVAFWGHASGALKRAATEFIDLDPWYNDISM